MKEIRYVIEGLRCCADDRDCECCPYNGEAYCEDSMKTDAAEWLEESVKQAEASRHDE